MRLGMVKWDCKSQLPVSWSLGHPCPVPLPHLPVPWIYCVCYMTQEMVIIFPHMYLYLPEHKALWTDTRSFVMDTPEGISVLSGNCTWKILLTATFWVVVEFHSCRIAYKIPKLPSKIRTSCGLSSRREKRIHQSLLNFSLGLRTVKGGQLEPPSLEICKLRLLLLLIWPQSDPPHHQGWARLQAIRGKWVTPEKAGEGTQDNLGLSAAVSVFSFVSWSLHLSCCVTSELRASLTNSE